MTPFERGALDPAAANVSLESTTGGWRSRPVFVASTFRDMDAERDHLQAFVFPELAERLRARRCELIAIDLRWGVETGSISEEEAKELLVLKVCLAEIERSKPFFVGLLGDRYGWVPPSERMRRAALEAGYEGDLANKSVTALEIEFGALATPGQRQRSFFYLRDPLPYDEMGAEAAARYSDAYARDAGASARAVHLTELRERLEVEHGNRIRHYKLGWDAATGHVTGLEAFGRLVAADLWRVLDEDTTASVLETPKTWEDDERAAFEEFVHERSRGFVGRDAVLSDLIRFVTTSEAQVHRIGESLTRGARVFARLRGLYGRLHGAPQEWGVCVVGKPGSGKSALLAELYGQLRNRFDVVVLAHSAGCSIRSSSVEMLLQRWIEELCAQRGIPAPRFDGTTSREDLDRAFADLVSETSTRHRLVLLVDSLHEFERTPTARHLSWLPDPWPANTRLVATSLPGSESETLKSHGARLMPLHPLGAREARQLIATVCGGYHRRLFSDVIGALVDTRKSQREPAAGNPLWLQMAVEELLLLDADDFARLTEFAGTGEQQLNRLLLDTVEGFPSDVGSMYETLLDRTEAIYGQRFTRSFAELVALSRTGLRESDLRTLMPQVSGDPWDELRFAALRRGMRAHVGQRGILGQWDFVHSQAREAVLHRSLATRESRRSLHETMASHLEQLPTDDPLRISELMYHLIEAEDRERAARHLGGQISDAASRAATGALAQKILASDVDPNPGVTWACSLLDTQYANDPVARLRLADRLRLLMGRLSDDAPVNEQIAIASNASRAIPMSPESQVTLRLLWMVTTHLGRLHRKSGDLIAAQHMIDRAIAQAEEMNRRAPSSAQAVRDLTLTRILLSEIQRARGDMAGARATAQQCLVPLEDLRARDPNDSQTVRYLAIVCNTLGEMADNLATAQGHFTKALALEEEQYHRAPDESETARSLSVCQYGLARVYRIRGRWDAAEAMANQCISVREHLFRRMPDSAIAARDLAVIYEELGYLRVAQREKWEPGRQLFERGMAIREELCGRVEDNATEIEALVVSLSNGAQTCLILGDVRQARRYFRWRRRVQRRFLDHSMQLSVPATQLMTKATYWRLRALPRLVSVLFVLICAVVGVALFSWVFLVIGMLFGAFAVTGMWIIERTRKVFLGRAVKKRTAARSAR